MLNAEIKVGQKWKTRGGDVVEIIQDAQDHQPFKGSNGYWYFKSGVIYKGSINEVDLVELLTERCSAESLRNSILNIRSKREALQKEILQLDEQEKEAVEKLKAQGFILADDPTEEGSSFCVEVGDIVRCISVEDPEYSIGDLNTSLDKFYTVEHVFGEVDGKQKVSVEERVGGVGLVGVNYEFHSRPVK